MAQKKSGNHATIDHIAGFCSFWAIMLSGVIYAITIFMQKVVKGNFNPGILNSVASILLTLGVLLPGWRYLESNNLPGSRWIWRILYWLFAFLIFFGVIGIQIFKL